MRRIVITAVASLAILAIVPASSLAKHHKRHHSRSHHSRLHHSRVRHERFGATNSTTTTPTASDTAGTISDFTNGTLTITLTNGQTVSGTVNQTTEIDCSSPNMNSSVHMDGDNGDGGNNQAGGGDENGTGNDQGDNDGDENGDEAASCGTSSLTQNAVVREAELTISSAGAVWDKIELAG
jgi:Tfp pilus assembly protein PilE